MGQSFEDYQDLSGVGYQGGSEKVAPEDEFFHSIYIAGKTRKNHINIEERSGKIQIRGVDYNLNEAHMVITHTKDVLLKTVFEGERDTIKCFSYREGSAPWFGTSNLPDGNKRSCPLTSAERAANSFCNGCKAQIIVAGIYCNQNGSPVLTEEKKPIFVFIRGKGMKYSNVSEYLSDRYNEDLDPIFTPVTEQSNSFEKKVVNNKRFVVKLTRGTETTRHGNIVNVFVLEKGTGIPNDAVMKILKLSKDTLSKFNEKFDWSKNQGLTSTTKKPEGIMEIGEPVDEKPDSTESEEIQSTQPDQKKFSFDEIEF